MYGSSRQFKVVGGGGGDQQLNEGIGDTSAFRGRLLLSIDTTIIEGEMAGRSTVKREPLLRTSAVVSRALCSPTRLNKAASLLSSSEEG